MANIGSSVTSYLLGLMASDSGLNSQLRKSADQGSEYAGSVESIVAQNAPSELLERSQQVQYPAVYIYCDKLNNALKEKFATFSGQAKMVVEVRCSQDRIEGIERQLDRYVDAACRVLDGARGSWQDGAFFTGGYEVAYGTVRHGGKNFIQVAKITFAVEVSR